MKTFITATAIFAATSAFAISAQADTIDLETPMQAVSIHTGGIDMVAYYLDQDDHFQLTATYIEPSDPTNPLRIQMALQDGDHTSFSLPGFKHIAYNFQRTGTSISIDANVIGTKIAHK